MMWKRGSYESSHLPFCTCCKRALCHDVKQCTDVDVSRHPCMCRHSLRTPIDWDFNFSMLYHPMPNKSYFEAWIKESKSVTLSPSVPPLTCFGLCFNRGLLLDFVLFPRHCSTCGHLSRPVKVAKILGICPTLASPMAWLSRKISRSVDIFVGFPHYVQLEDVLGEGFCLQPACHICNRCCEHSCSLAARAWCTCSSPWRASRKTHSGEVDGYTGERFLDVQPDRPGQCNQPERSEVKNGVKLIQWLATWWQWWHFNQSFTTSSKVSGLSSTVGL